MIRIFVCNCDLFHFRRVNAEIGAITVIIIKIINKVIGITIVGTTEIIVIVIIVIGPTTIKYCATAVSYNFFAEYFAKDI